MLITNISFSKTAPWSARQRSNLTAITTEIFPTLAATRSARSARAAAETSLLHTTFCCPQCHNYKDNMTFQLIYQSIKCKMSNSFLRDHAKMFNCLSRSALLLSSFHMCILLVCCAVMSGAVSVNAAAINHKQHHNGARLFSWNNLSENNEAFNSDSNDNGYVLNADPKFSAESSIAATDSKPNTGCPTTTSSHCLRCNNEGCIKCPSYLVTDTRQCVEKCPSGYIDQWSAHTEFMGRVCVSTGYSGPLMAALAGMLGGFLVCFSLLAVAVMLVRKRRRRKTIKQKLINEHTMDRSDFLRQLNEMRPNAEYFLAMLNDTRRQIRKLYLSGEIAAANSYRPIVRDLAKILILLNRPIELIPAPPVDWSRLYAWSEQALERYKPQVGQLIDFFQTSQHAGTNDEFDTTNYNKKNTDGNGVGSSSIFRQNMLQSTTNLNTPGSTGTATHKMHLFGSLISLHEFEEPRPSDPFGSSFNTLKSGNLISDLNASSLWLEDEFYKLGFRPQDEITTEL
ncbi:uncharacterized protein LOC119683119 [Teleopsis dalmanni]|uniref:uncharacterized protein LOC119682148 n=1 Tax=Teleopsis dalmanni TaxID=139649 RepID=UPI0018CFC589|nr:uncharacterized protein LOC119682148 [Teleopsis dalmanni]XP_037952659.1 uncharacterized protein LOC119683119 [Teleopsis dalmanni]